MAILNRDRAEGIRRAIAKIETDAASDRAAARQLRAMASRDDLLDELAAQEAAGTLTRDQVDARLTEFDLQAESQRRSADARDRVAEHRERDLAALNAELAQLAFADQIAIVERRVDELEKAQAAVPRAISALVKAFAQLAEATEAESAARDALEQVRPAGETRTVDVEDAPDWPDVHELVKALTAGPAQPARTARISSRRSAAAAAAARRSAIGDAIRLFATRNAVDERALRARGYDDDAIAAVHAEHERLVQLHAERETGFVRIES
jgi:hypothetical protein